MCKFDKPSPVIRSGVIGFILLENENKIVQKITINVYDLTNQYQFKTAYSRALYEDGNGSIKYNEIMSLQNRVITGLLGRSV